jgi:hypothetical protein
VPESRSHPGGHAVSFGFGVHEYRGVHRGSSSTRRVDCTLHLEPVLTSSRLPARRSRRKRTARAQS